MSEQNKNTTNIRCRFCGKEFIIDRKKPKSAQKAWDELRAHVSREHHSQSIAINNDSKRHFHTKYGKSFGALMNEYKRAQAEWMSPKE